MFDGHREGRMPKPYIPWVRRIRALAIGLLVVLSVIELLCAGIAYIGYSDKHIDYSYALGSSRAEYRSLLTAVPQHEEYAQRIKRTETRIRELESDYRQTLWEESILFIIALFASVIVVIGCSLVLSREQGKRRKTISALEDVRGGKPCITGTRIAVIDVALRHLHDGQPLKVIAAEYGLPIGVVHTAMAYYYDHQSEIDARCRDDEAFVETLRATIPSRLPATPRAPHDT